MESIKPEKNGLNLLSRSALFSAALFMLVLAVGGAIFTVTTRQSIRTMKNDEMAASLERERVRFEGMLGGKIEIVKKMSESRQMRRYFSEPHNGVIERLAREEIREIIAALPEGDNVFWVNNVDKTLYYNDPLIAVIDPSDSANAWYNATLIDTEVFNVNVNYNADLDKLNIWVNAPVTNNTRVPIGIIGTGSDLWEFINSFYGEYDDFADLFFVDGAGVISCAMDTRHIVMRKRLEDRLGYVGREMMDAARKLAPGETQIFHTPKGTVGISRAAAFEWYAVMFTASGVNDFKIGMTWFLIAMAVVFAVILIAVNIFIVWLFKPLRDTMKALSAALKVKDDFLAKMSHEIRTPMNAITGMAELALREDMPPAAQEHVYTIKQAGSNLLSIINDILDLSKIESGKLNIVPAEYHFGTLVNDVVSIIRMRVVDSPVRFVVNVDSKIPALLYGDEVRVRQILLNILSNAVKYTKEGHISLVINGVMADDDTVNLHIDVADTGKGIKPEDLRKLFGSFVQVDVEANRGIEGTGLGLVITKNLTNAMGGNITVRSVYGKGSTFTILLPQKIATSEPLAAVDAPEAKGVIVYERRDIYANSIVCTVDNLGVNCACAQSINELCDKLKNNKHPFVFVESALYEDIKDILADVNSRAKIVLLTSFGNVVADKDLSVIAMPVHTVSVANILNGVSDGFSYHTEDSTLVRFNAPDARVLVVDDIKTNLEVTRGLLSPYKMQVDICLSGTESIKMAGANDYDLIFMDHMMPDMNGITAARRIRELGGAYERVPIVALTANAVSGAKEMFLENGFNGFLSKPVDIPKFNAILEKWIPKKKRTRAEKKTERMEIVPEILIPGVDVKAGIARMGGDIETYMRTLTVFRSDGREKIHEIKRCLETGNMPMFTIAVHALKGAAGNVGASVFAESAKLMEMAGKREDRAYIKDNIGRLLHDLDTLLRVIGDAVNAERDRRSVAQPIRSTGAASDNTAVITALEELQRAMDVLDPDALNAAAKELRRLAEVSEYGAQIDDILKNTLIGEYDAALSLIGSLLEEAR